MEESGPGEQKGIYVTGENARIMAGAVDPGLGEMEGAGDGRTDVHGSMCIV